MYQVESKMVLKIIRISYDAMPIDDWNEMYNQPLAFPRSQNLVQLDWKEPKDCWACGNCI